MENYDRIIDRLFEEVDENSSRIEKLSKTVYSHSGLLKILQRIVLTILVLLISTTLILFSDSAKEKYTNKVNKAVVRENAMNSKRNGD